MLIVYEEWSEWRDRRERYLDYKSEHYQEWELWKNTVFSKIIDEALDYYFECDLNLGVEKDYAKRNYEAFEYFKRSTLWNSTDNGQLIYSEKYSVPYKTEQELEFYAWIDVVNWSDKFTVWKIKNPQEWERLKKDTFIKLDRGEQKKALSTWIEQNRDIWNKLKEEFETQWEEWRKSHEEFLWCLYVDDKWNMEDNDQFFLFYDTEDEEHQEIISFFSSLQKSEAMKEFIKKECSLDDMYSYVSTKKSKRYSYGLISQDDWRFEEMPQEYANRRAFELWRIKYKQEWEEWIGKYIWLDMYDNWRRENKVYYELTDYFEVWKSLNSAEWEKWKKDNFTDWKEKNNLVEKWIGWIKDGNELVFHEWAKDSLEDWNRSVFFEFSCVSSWNLSYDEKWMKEKVDGCCWEDIFVEQMLINIWANEHNEN